MTVPSKSRTAADSRSPAGGESRSLFWRSCCPGASQPWSPPGHPPERLPMRETRTCGSRGRSRSPSSRTGWGSSCARARSTPRRLVRGRADPAGRLRHAGHLRRWTRRQTVDIVGSGPGEVVEFDGRDAPNDPAAKRARLEAA